MTLDIFARPCLFPGFSKSGSTINTNCKHHFQIFAAICCIANTITLSAMHVRFIALNLGTSGRFRKGDILSWSCCHAVSQPFGLLNVRMFVQVIRQNVWVSCRKFGGISPMRSRNIAFLAILYIFCVTREHAISTLARRFRQIIKSKIYVVISRILFLLNKMVYAMIWLMKLNYAFSDRQHA